MIRSVVLVSVLFILSPGFLFATDQVFITVDAKGVSKEFNPSIFGQNSLGYDPCRTQECPNERKATQLTQYGLGQWDPVAHKPSPALAQIARDLGVTSLRYPGGTPANYHDWKATIGPLRRRPGFKFGLDEFLALCASIGAEPVITLSYFSDTDQDMEDLVSYLNLTPGRVNISSKDWAQERVRNGHASPYGVRYFELGNEVYVGDHDRNAGLTPRSYAERYLRVQERLKALDPSVLVGAVFTGWDHYLSDWDRAVAKVLGPDLDYAVIHIYPFSLSKNFSIGPGPMYDAVIASSVQIRDSLDRMARELETICGRPVPLAITEFNGGFKAEEPVPLRHSLGNALFVADMLNAFLTAKANILCANLWHFSNSHWGIVHNPGFMDGKGGYIKRPVALVYEIFAKLQNRRVLPVSAQGPTYRSQTLGSVMATGHDRPPRTSGSKPLSTVRIAPRDWKKRLGMFGVDYVQERESMGLVFQGKDTNFHHLVAKVPVQPGRHYRLSGRIKTEDLTTRNGVCLQVNGSGGKDTAWIKTSTNISGTTGWEDVGLEFTAPDDMETIAVTIRRVAGAGKVTGKAWVRDVVLQEVGEGLWHPATPYVSALATTNQDGSELSLMLLNRSQNQFFPAKIEISNMRLGPEVRLWTLAGKGMLSANELNPTEVRIKEEKVQVQPGSQAIKISLEPASLTLMNFQQKK